MRRTHVLIISAAFACAAGAAALAQSGPMGPMRRPGLWEMKMQAEGSEGRNFAMQVCVDPNFERSHGVFNGGPMAGHSSGERDNCSAKEFHPIPGGMAFHSVCAANGGTVVTDGTSTGDYQSHYHVDVTTRHAPGGVRHMTMDGRWVGPCAPGQAGGDMSMVLPNGQTMHMPGGMGMGRPGG
jgi:hypothetical protein